MKYTTLNAILSALWTSTAISAQSVFQYTPITFPSLQFGDFGNNVGFLGDFDSLAFYNYQGKAGNTSSLTENSVYIKNSTNDDLLQIGVVDGSITQMINYSNDSVLIIGDFTSFNNDPHNSPIIFNTTSGDIIPLDPDGDIDGEIKTVLVDNELIYFGGNLTFNNTNGVVVYDISSASLSSTKFQGFNNNSIINSIIKVGDESDDYSIVFGGNFYDLGLSDLLTHNFTNTTIINSENSTNLTNLSVTTDQLVSLKHATFTGINTNSDSDDPSSIICPSSDSEFVLTQGSAGEWRASLPFDVVPTKIRIYNSQTPNEGVSLFRFYTFPANGIMNLTYIDPNTQQLSVCDAWCPLLSASELLDVVGQQDLDNDAFAYRYGSNNGSLGYGSTYQEFALVNSVSMNSLTLTLLQSYGDFNSISGFELFTSTTTVYANNSLNDPNCGSISNDASSSELMSGSSWESSLDDYIISTVSVSESYDNIGVTYYPNISYSGNYSILVYTPGCLDDNTCSQRGIVSATLYDGAGTQLASESIYQNNDYEKFDFLYAGHINVTDQDSDKPRIDLKLESNINGNDGNTIVMVAEKVDSSIISLDIFSQTNQTNSTEQRTILSKVPINGIFEYSVSNFSDFEYSTFNNSENNLIGNSTFNLMGLDLSDNATINSMVELNNSIFIGGDFSTSDFGNSLLQFDLTTYNSSSNESDFRVSSDFNNLNGNISTLIKIGDSEFIAAGSFTDTNSSSVTSLSNNSTVGSIQNIALYKSSSWYSFGTNSVANITTFTTVQVDGTEYFIFNGYSDDYQVWDNTDFKWVTNNTTGAILNVSQAVDIPTNGFSLLVGTASIMDYYVVGEAIVTSNDTFSSYGLNLSNIESNELFSSQYVNSSLSVIGGLFSSDVNGTSISGLAFVGDNGSVASVEGLNPGVDVSINTLFAYGDYLYIGSNGTLNVTAISSVTQGLTIYNLANNSFNSIQPAQLSAPDGSVNLNAIAINPDSNQLIVGGDFDQAGSLSCPVICIYDISNTRWENTISNTVEGVANDMKFYTSNDILIAGNFTIDGQEGYFASYDFSSQQLNITTGLSVGLTGPVNKFILSDNSNDGRIIAMGEDFIAGYNKSSWSRIDDEINVSNSVFTDMKLLALTKSNSENHVQYFEQDQVLLVAGLLDLKEYGPVNAAFFNGSSWIPYIYTDLRRDTNSTGIGGVSRGIINAIMDKDSFENLSPDDISANQMSTGKVVGISLACAVGTIGLLAVLYTVPYYILMKKDTKSTPSQRIAESDMMQTVNPEDLIHEMDVQRGIS